MTDEELQRVKARFGIIGNDDKLNQAIAVAMQVAPSDLSVLITGESGVGKEFFPQIIHHNSIRKHGPYIPVNCGAIPEGTVDSELFGHEKGAFTGAVSDKKGFFEAANGGTIFLDEVGELPLSTQVRLLRVLEVGEFNRVGSAKPLKTDVRVVAATNVDMLKAVNEGRFREDLYYRLSTIPIKVPSLKDRGRDSVLLFRHFANAFAEKYNATAIRLTDEAADLVSQYTWPGNVRQIKNIVEQISIIEKENRIISADTLLTYLPVTGQRAHLPVLTADSESKQEHSYEQEREVIFKVLFDLKKEVQDLKQQLSDMSLQQRPQIPNNSNLPIETESHIARINTHPDIQPDEVYGAQDIQYDGSAQSLPNRTKKKIRKEFPYAQLVESEERETGISKIEKEKIIEVLNRHNYCRRTSAAELGVSERTLYRKMKSYGIS